MNNLTTGHSSYNKNLKSLPIHKCKQSELKTTVSSWLTWYGTGDNDRRYYYMSQSYVIAGYWPSQFHKFYRKDKQLITKGECLLCLFTVMSPLLCGLAHNFTSVNKQKMFELQMMFFCMILHGIYKEPQEKLEISTNLNYACLN